MNCLEFRRTVSMSPQASNAEAEAHLAKCASCRSVAAKAARNQRVLRDAVRVPVPEDLVASILMSQSFAHRRERMRRRRRWLAAVAVVVLGVAIGVFVAWPQYRQSVLENEVLALVAAADYALENRDEIDPGSVTQALSPVGYRVRPGIGKVSFAGRCLVRGALAGHLVVREEAAPVTVFLVPHLDISGQPEFGNADWSGMMFASPGRGVIVVLAPPDTELPPIVERIRSAVQGAV